MAVSGTGKRTSANVDVYLDPLPLDPNDVQVKNVTTSGMEMEWKRLTDTYYQYIIIQFQCQENETDDGACSKTTKTNNSNNFQSIDGLIPGAIYDMRLFSKTIHNRTSTEVSIKHAIFPEFPVNVTDPEENDTSIMISWEKPMGVVAKYKIEINPAMMTESDRSSFSNDGMSVFYITETTLNLNKANFYPGFIYNVTLNSVNGHGNLSLPVPRDVRRQIEPPGNFRNETQTTSNFTLRWIKPFGYVTHYELTIWENYTTLRNKIRLDNNQTGFLQPNCIPGEFYNSTLTAFSNTGNSQVISAKIDPDRTD